jgi:hypothetical protein
MLGIIMLIVTIKPIVLGIIILSVTIKPIMLDVIMLSVVLTSIIYAGFQKHALYAWYHNAGCCYTGNCYTGWHFDEQHLF